MRSFRFCQTPHSIFPLLAFKEQAATLDGNNGPQENQRLPLFNELKRRNVFKVTVAYIIVAWLLLQVSDTLVPALQLPEWFHSGVAVLLILGLPVIYVIVFGKSNDKSSSLRIGGITLGLATKLWPNEC